MINGIVGNLPEEGFTHRLIDTNWVKGTAIVVCQGEETRDWLGSKVPTMSAWEGCRLKMVGLDTLPGLNGGLVSEPFGGYGALFSATPYAESGTGYQSLEGLSARRNLMGSALCSLLTLRPSRR